MAGCVQKKTSATLLNGESVKCTDVTRATNSLDNTQLLPAAGYCVHTTVHTKDIHVTHQSFHLLSISWTSCITSHCRILPWCCFLVGWTMSVSVCSHIAVLLYSRCPWSVRRHEKYVRNYKLNIFKMAAFWFVAPCRIVRVYQRFRGLYDVHHCPDGGGSRLFWNISKLLPEDAAQRPRIKNLFYKLPVVVTKNL
jgi:hypothetical protein